LGTHRIERRDMTGRVRLTHPLTSTGNPIAFAILVLSLVLATAVSAQESPSTAGSQDFQSASLEKGATELGVLGGGGTCLGRFYGTQFVYAGGRFGRVLTGNHLTGRLRGNFEWAADIMPLYAVLPPASAIYGASIKPVIWQWNFTSGRKIAPYVAAAGGIVFSSRNVPPGDTSRVNFTPQFVFGTHVFMKPRRALIFEGSIAHLSSASLGPFNPGYNISFLFTVGYSWFKRAH
jgi:lipid A 3-O-deacylase